MNDVMIDRIAKARANGDFTDYVIVCEGQRLPVHKIIEASGEYYMDDHPLPMVLRMIDYLYTGIYVEHGPELLDMEDETDGGSSPLQLHAKMFALADKYDIKGLQTLSAANYAKAMRGDVNICSFIRSISDVYALGPGSSRELRDMAVGFARRRLGASVVSSTEEKECFDRLAADVPEFVKDLLDSFFLAPLVGRCSCCGYGILVPVTPPTGQCKCGKCGKGGLTPIAAS